MNITGIERRNRLYSNYQIRVIGCISLYDGSTVKSDAGGNIITDKYYQFFCIPKNPELQNQTVTCGYPVAKEICEHCHLEIPSCFNPFQEEHGTREGGNPNNYGNHNAWNPVARSLYNAIMLIITRFRLSDNSAQQSPIFNILDDVKKYHSYEPWVSKIKSINTILIRFNTSMPQILTEIAQHGHIRAFNFDTLDEALRNDNPDIDSRFV